MQDLCQHTNPQLMNLSMLLTRAIAEIDNGAPVLEPWLLRIASIAAPSFWFNHFYINDTERSLGCRVYRAYRVQGSGFYLQSPL